MAAGKEVEALLLKAADAATAAHATKVLGAFLVIPGPPAACKGCRACTPVSRVGMAAGCCGDCCRQ